MSARVRLLDMARRAVEGRAESYGKPEKLFGRIAERWSLRFGITITARQVALCLIDMKIERADAGQTDDASIDIAGYAACLFEIDENAA